jgi:hypothetical protein
MPGDSSRQDFGDGMNKVLASACLLAVTLTGCGANASTNGPTPTATVTVTVTATPPAPPRSATPLALGASAATPSGGTVTVYEHRKGIEPQDANQEAIDVKVCTGAKPAGESSEITIGVSPWAIYDAEDRRYTYASSTWEHGGAQPGYPVQEKVQWGDCIRGWVIIQGQAATQMTKVRYTSGSSILEWKLAP